MKLKITILFLCLTLLGCVGPQIHYQQLVLLDKGMTEESVVQVLSLPPLYVHNAMVAQDHFRFLQYHMNNGVSFSLYLLVIKNNKLIYWGYIDDIRKQPDKNMHKALDSVIRKVLYIDLNPPKKEKVKN